MTTAMKAGARSSDPWTSHAAADDVLPKAPMGRTLVLRALAASPMTDYELAAFTGWQQNSIGKRRLENQRKGLVKPHLGADGVQLTRPAPSGSMSLVWEITPAGLTSIGDDHA